MEEHNGKVHLELKDSIKYFILTENDKDLPNLKNNRSFWIDVEWFAECILANEFIFPDKYLLRGECKILDSIDFNCNLNEIESHIEE